MGEVLNMALISFIVGFTIRVKIDKKKGIKEIRNRVIYGCIMSIICISIYILIDLI